MSNASPSRNSALAAIESIEQTAEMALDGDLASGRDDGQGLALTEGDRIMARRMLQILRAYTPELQRILDDVAAHDRDCGEIAYEALWNVVGAAFAIGNRCTLNDWADQKRRASFKMPPGTRGPKPRQELIKYEEEAVRNLQAAGNGNPSMRAISMEVARLRQLAEPDREIDPETERRRLRRRREPPGT